MLQKKIISLLMASVIASLSIFNVAFAEEGDASCTFDMPEKMEFHAKTITVRKKLRVNSGEKFEVKVYVKNESNVPWFSPSSDCNGPKLMIGTDRPRDRFSYFYTPKIEGIENTNWVGDGRVALDQERVNPGKIASFSFWVETEANNDVIKEYFRPVIEGVTWIEDDDALIEMEMIFGEPGENPAVLRKKINFAVEAGSVKDIDLNAEKMLLVDLSDQHVYLKLGDKTIRDFPVSTGKSRTPTPIGETRITEKNVVRVGNAPPHYVMPKFMMFRAGGYGFHALPSLSSDGGIFWTEALNHIGIPVSHGCIRLLPQDADFLFDFTEIGTIVKVVR